MPAVSPSLSRSVSHGPAGRRSLRSENTHLGDGCQELLHAAVAVSLGLQRFSDVLGVGHGKFMEEKLLVVVSVQ